MPFYCTDAALATPLERQIVHFRGCTVSSQGSVKVERYHRLMKNVIRLRNYDYPWEFDQALGEFVEYYSKHRYLVSLDNLTPEDVYYGREKIV